MRTGLVIAIAVVLTGTAAACTRSGPPGGEPPLGPVPTVRTVSDIVFPLDAYDFTPEQRDTVILASEILTRQCAARYGVDYAVTPPPYDQPTYEDLHGGRFGIFQLDRAQQYGYIPPPRPSTGGKERGWNPGPQELLVVVGHSNSSTAGLPLPVDANGARLDEDGCSGWASRKLQEGAPGVDQRAVLDEVSGSVYDSEKDSRVVAVFKNWSECMAGKGYTYASPRDANNQSWPDPATDEEIATAVADVQCKQQVNLVGIWLAVETAYQNRAIEQHAEQLKRVKESIDVQLRNAAAVIAGHR